MNTKFIYYLTHIINWILEISFVILFISFLGSIDINHFTDTDIDIKTNDEDKRFCLFLLATTLLLATAYFSSTTTDINPELINALQKSIDLNNHLLKNIERNNKIFDETINGIYKILDE